MIKLSVWKRAGNLALALVDGTEVTALRFPVFARLLDCKNKKVKGGINRVPGFAKSIVSKTTVISLIHRKRLYIIPAFSRLNVTQYNNIGPVENGSLNWASAKSYKPYDNSQ